MGNNDLKYNEPFEKEEWIWSINNVQFHVSKYRQIDCDKEAGYYYDFIRLEFKNKSGEDLFWMRRYNDTPSEISFMSNPFIIIENELIELIGLLMEKYHLEEFKYFDERYGYKTIDVDSVIGTISSHDG